MKDAHDEVKRIDIPFIRSLCDILSEHGSFKKYEAHQLEEAFKGHSAAHFEDFLLEEDIVEKEALLQALAVHYDLPAIDVIGIFFDHQLVRMFPKDCMLRNGFIPYDRDGEMLVVIAARPTDSQLPAIIGQFVSYDVTFMVGIFFDICDQVKEFYDESIEKADIELFEDTKDEHEKDPLRDVFEDIVDQD